MKKALALPIESTAIRFAPAKGGEPASAIWRVWAEGNEIYALTRNAGGVAKISVHASGQIHYRLGPKHKQDMAPLMPLLTSQWSHAFEVRFLLSEGARTPLDERKSLKGKSAYLVALPDGLVLYVNLVIGPAGAALDLPLPLEFSGAQALWRTRLPDGRIAVLLARVMALDIQNRENIKNIRERIKPAVTFATMPEEAYLEVHHVIWSVGGNVVLVVPMGDEAIRSEQTSPPEIPVEPRKFSYQSPRSSVAILAPNGLPVASLDIEHVEKQFELFRDRPSRESVGTINLRLEQNNLIAGSKFMAAPCWLECLPRMGGGTPREWRYTVFAIFDGSTLSAEIRPISCALRNKNVRVSGLENQDELLMVIPAESIKLIGTFRAPTSSAELVGRFTLRDAR